MSEAMTVEALRERLAEHRFTLGGCSCGWKVPSNTPMLPAFEAHQADALLPVVREYAKAEKAAAWDEGKRAERRDWELLFDITTPDEERQPLPNPYRAALGDDR